MWNNHLEEINIATDRSKLSSPQANPFHVLMNHNGLKAQGAETEESDKILAMKVIELAQTERASTIVFVHIKDRKLRFIIDYPKTIVVTKRESFYYQRWPSASMLLEAPSYPPNFTGMKAIEK